MSRVEQLKALALRHQLTVAILATIVIAIIMTAISLSLYASSGTLQLDLSRPGYESARKDITKPEDDTDFAATGVIDQQVLEDYQRRFDNQRNSLNSFSKFKDKGLDDDSLTLSPNTQN